MISSKLFFMYLRFIFISNIETPVQNMNCFSAAPSIMFSYTPVLEAPSIHYPLSPSRQRVFVPVKLFFQPGLDFQSPFLFVQG